MPRRTLTLGLGILLWAFGLVWIFVLDDPRLRFPQFIGGWAIASIGWLILISQARKTSGPRHLGLVLIGLGFGARLWAWSLSPAMSEDVFRYVYEGRLVWVLGPTAPFLHPPASGPQLGLPPALLDEAWWRINHPELSTIYPPIAQLVFAIAGGLGELWGRGHLALLKALLIGADLGTWWFLHLALRKAGQPRGASVIWGLSPLVIWETAREGHADGLSALGLAIGIWGFAAARPRQGYLGWATAALAKLNGLLVLPAAARVTRRGLVPAILLLGLLALPYLFASGSTGGLSAYAQRWRAGDGAFSLLLGLAEFVLGGDWARIGGTTVTRHQLARLFVGGLFGLIMLATLWRPYPKARIPERAGTLLLALLLLTPTLHPWYVMWLLPFATAAEHFSGRRAVLVLATVAALLHHPGYLELSNGEWRDLAEIRAVVHVPVWAMWGWDLVARRRLG